MLGKKKEITLDLSNVSSGLNTNDPPNSIGEHQVQGCKNAILQKMGWKKIPGFLGMASSIPVASFLQKIHILEEIDGTETLLGVAGGRLYAINTTTGVFTELYNLGGSGMAHFVNAHGKTWVCDGTAVIKVESSTTAYLVGIAAPSGSTAEAVSGGSLATGVYQVYAGYARKVGGSIVLYSQGESCGSVTLAAANLTVRVTIPNSSDAQVNDKVVWMTDAAGTVYYYYGETDNNTSAYKDISATTDRNTSLLYTVQASLNYRPPAFTRIFAHNNMIIGTLNNVAYWSKSMASAYDGERFNTEATGRNYTYPYHLKGIFAIGPHLYFNAPPGGIIQVPNGDFNAKYELKGQGTYFLFENTIDVYGDRAYGWTNRGFMLFDGETFLNVNGVLFDMAKDLKPEFDKMISGADSTFYPVGKVVKQNERTEYHISFRDSNISSIVHNRHFVLDLDTVGIYNADKYKIPWEKWEGGVSTIAQEKGGTVYFGQSQAGGSLVYKIRSDSKQDRYVFNKSGAFLDAETDKLTQIKSRVIIPAVDAIVIWTKLHVISENRKGFSIKIYMVEEGGFSHTTSLSASATNVATFPLIFPFELYDTVAKIQRKGLPRKLSGYNFYVVFEQTDNDTEFQMQRLQLTGVLKKTNYT